MKNLANEVRPKSIDDVIGQTHVIDVLKRIVKEKAKASFLFFGNPGIGKTSIAIALANDLKMSYAKFNAATDTKKEMTFIIDNYDAIIIDEIHRLNKDKQDVLLPFMEKGRVIVFATTTENPYFVVNPAVRSRMHVLELKSLSQKELEQGINKIIKSHLSIKVPKVIVSDIAALSNGDFRYALNALDLLNKLYKDEKITKAIVKQVLPSVHFASDRNGTLHYDHLSAFHKSLRGSSADASLYYLAYLIKSGDFEGLFRRLYCVAYEDVGLSNPNISLKVKAAIDTFRYLGMPEGARCLAQVTIELALSAKSDSVNNAMSSAMSLIESGNVFDVPSHLRDKSYKSSSKVNKETYLYPHNYKEHYVDQEYLPKELKGLKIYEPGSSDIEIHLNKWVNQFRK